MALILQNIKYEQLSDRLSGSPCKLSSHLITVLHLLGLPASFQTFEVVSSFFAGLSSIIFVPRYCLAPFELLLFFGFLFPPLITSLHLVSFSSTDSSDCPEAIPCIFSVLYFCTSGTKSPFPSLRRSGFKGEETNCSIHPKLRPDLYFNPSSPSPKVSVKKLLSS